MKYLGIDFGTVRVGLAVTDPAGTMAFPLATLTRTTRDALFAELLRIVETENIEAIVLGYPESAPGLKSEEGLIQRQIKNFAASLARRVDISIHLVDETLSSAAAEEELREAGLTGAKLAQALDQQAAVRLLETFLSQQPKP